MYTKLAEKDPTLKKLGLKKLTKNFSAAKMVPSSKFLIRGKIGFVSNLSSGHRQGKINEWTP